MSKQPTRETMLAAIRVKCVEANAGIWEWHTASGTLKLGRGWLCEKCGKLYDPPCMLCGCEHGTTRTYRPIRLADVLHAVHEISDHHLRDEFCMQAVKMGLLDSMTNYPLGSLIVELWNLLRDSLDDQSDECIAFLYSLLCTKP